MSRKRSPLAVERERNEIARLKLDTQLREKKASILAKYDAVEGGTKRRQPINEVQNEDQVYDQNRRGLGINIGRDLERNYAPAKGILHQFRMNVVGALGKLQVNCKGGDEAAAWFNQEWAKDCDFREDMHFSDVLQNIVANVPREGDLLAVVDDGIIPEKMGGTKGGTGKLLHWEADQIVKLGEGALKSAPAPYPDCVQENGILRNKWGKVIGFVTTGTRGKLVIDDIKEATIWNRENARHVKNPWRLNQGRGVPSMITNATNFIDLYEMLSIELQSAKRTGVIAGYVKRTEPTNDWDTPTTGATYLPENTGKSAATTALENANSTDPTAKNYEQFEALAGGYFEYMDKGDEAIFPPINRPNVHMAEFIEAVLCYAGASMGLAKAYTLLRADSSYTAFRGDMILSWASAFYPMQKWLERKYADWVAVKVIRWALAKGILAALEPGWERTLSWKWPVMPHVDEARESIAESQSLKNGSTDYSELLGPEWRTKFVALAEQLNVARDLGLPLSVFEQKSGGAAPSESEGQTTKTDDENANKKKKEQVTE